MSRSKTVARHRYWIKKDGAFDEARTKYYVARTVLGLKAIHDIGLVYRDLKPENVLVDTDGRTRLSDMGLAVPYTEGMTGCSGTSGYIPPEAIKGEVYDRTADWFALGCMAYEFFNQRSPYRTEAAHDWLVNEFKGGAQSASL